MRNSQNLLTFGTFAATFLQKQVIMRAEEKERLLTLVEREVEASRTDC